MEYEETKKYYNNDKLLKSFFDNNSKIIKAYEFAKKAHKGQKRKSGVDYMLHCLAVAIRLHEKYNDTILTCAAMLHDVVEDCEEIPIQDIYKLFGKKVGFIVDALNKYKKTFYELPHLQFSEKIERFLYAGIKDVRVFLLKIADREDNLLTLNYLKNNKQIRMTFETQAVYDPLKSILKYDEKQTISNLQKKFKQFLLKHKLTDTIQDLNKLKNYLFKTSFENFNEHLYNIVYENASQITWKIEGWDMYDKICDSKEFENKISIINVLSDGENVTAYFKFKKGISSTYKNNIKMQISTFSEKW